MDGGDVNEEMEEAMTKQVALRLITGWALLMFFTAVRILQWLEGILTPLTCRSTTRMKMYDFVIQEGTAPINCEEVDKCDPEQISQQSSALTAILSTTT